MVNCLFGEEICTDSFGGSANHEGWDRVNISHDFSGKITYVLLR